MQSGLEEISFSARCFHAFHDVLTSLCCVAYWAGMWSLLDVFKVDEVASGCAAVFLVVILAWSKSDELLERLVGPAPAALQVLLVWLWTCFLAVLSLIVWRISFFGVHIFLHPGNNPFAVVVTLVGIAILVPVGRYRSASCAPPVGVVVDAYSPGRRFSTAAYSGHNLGEACLDVVLTLPVVFVWAGIWMLLDNLAVPPVLCCIVCFGWISICSVFFLSDRLRDCCAGLGVLSAVADVMWTTLKTVACIGVWRGAWETALHELDLHKAPQAVATFLGGAVGLTLLQRHSSACFPPVDFSSDDGDHFHAVGSVSFRLQPSEKDSLTEKAQSDAGSLQSAADHRLPA